MPIELTSNIIPKNNGSFPTHEAIYGRGGRREVDAVNDRDAIPASRRVSGMQVYVRSDQKTYVLQNNLTAWIEDPLATRLAAAESSITGISSSLSNLQPLSTNLTNLSTVANTTYGRSLLAIADAPSLRTSVGITVAKTAPDSSGNIELYAYKGFWEERPDPFLYPGQSAFFYDLGSYGATCVSNGLHWIPLQPVVWKHIRSEPIFLDDTTAERDLAQIRIPKGLPRSGTRIRIEPTWNFPATVSKTLYYKIQGVKRFDVFGTGKTYTDDTVSVSPLFEIYWREKARQFNNLMKDGTYTIGTTQVQSTTTLDSDATDIEICVGAKWNVLNAGPTYNNIALTKVVVTLDI